MDLVDITLLDGSMGRHLKQMGAPFRQPEGSALALIEIPEFVSQAHRDYIAAGAEVIRTNSYAIVPFHIGEERFAAEGRALAERAGRLAATVPSSRHANVAGSLPPLFGSYRPDLFDASRAPFILGTLIAGLGSHVDYWLAETQSSIAEAEAVHTALAGDGKPLWLAFTLLDEGTDLTTPRLRSGETVADAVRAAARLEASAVLFNCSQPEVMGPALDIAQATLAKLGASLKTGVYANAHSPQGRFPEDDATLLELREDRKPPAYVRWALDWAGRGASIVGGCCGTGPGHIRALYKALGQRF